MTIWPLRCYPVENDSDDFFAGPGEAISSLELMFGFVGCSDIRDNVPDVSISCMDVFSGGLDAKDARATHDCQ